MDDQRSLRSIQQPHEFTKQLTLVVPATENVVQSWPVARFEETDNESKTQECRVRLCAGETECEHSPPDFEEGNPDYGKWSISFQPLGLLKKCVHTVRWYSSQNEVRWLSESNISLCCFVKFVRGMQTHCPMM